MSALTQFAVAALALFVLLGVAALFSRPLLAIAHRQFDLMLDGQIEDTERHQ